MADNRAAKSGVAAEAFKKVAAKYSADQASAMLIWMKRVLVTVDGGGFAHGMSISGEADDFHDTLKDGIVLCRLANVLQPGIIPRIEVKSKMAFKCMENINQFTKAALELGVPQTELFQTVDLWERQNLSQVVICLESLARKAGKYGKPSIGPKEAERNTRNFSEHQLRAGEGVIGLQAGTNKGASQAGISFGTTRHM